MSQQRWALFLATHEARETKLQIDTENLEHATLAFYNTVAPTVLQGKNAAYTVFAP
jgi:hypothetical protein